MVTYNYNTFRCLLIIVVVVDYCCCCCYCLLLSMLILTPGLVLSCLLNGIIINIIKICVGRYMRNC